MYDFLRLKLNNYDKNNSKNWNKNKGNKISIRSIFEYNKYILLSVSPNQGDCSGYNYSECINFIFENEELKYTDLEIGVSTGDPIMLTDKFAFFTISGGDGDDCSFHGNITTFMIKLLSYEVFKEETVQNISCKNICPCSNEDEITEISRKYYIIKSDKKYSSEEFKELFEVN